MGFGLGFLFDPLKNLNKGMSPFGAPMPPTGGPNQPLSLLRADEPLPQGRPLGGDAAVNAAIGPLRKAEDPGFMIPSTGQQVPLADAPAAGASPIGLKIEPVAQGPLSGRVPADQAERAAPAGIVGGATAGPRSDGPPLATPVQASAANPPPDATIRAPYQTGGGAGAGIATPPPAGVVAPAAGGGPSTTGTTGTGAGGGAGPAPTKQLGQQSALGKLADMGKALGAAGGGAASGASGHAPGGMTSDPAAASRAGSSQLLQGVLEANKPNAVGGVPGLPGILQQRFRR